MISLVSVGLQGFFYSACMLAFPSDSNFSLFQIKLTSLHGRVAKMGEEIMKKPHGKYPSTILLILSLLYSENIWRNLQENRERGWKESWYSSLSTGVAVARTQVVKHADEAANAYQIFIRPGEAVQLVKEDEIERGRSISPPPSHPYPPSPLSTTGAVASAQPNSSSPTHLHLLSMEPWGHFVSEAIIIKRHNSTYKYLASFTAYEADSAQSMRGMSTCECACVHAAARPRRLPFSIGGERWAARGELVTFHCHGNSLQVTPGKLNTAMAIYSRGLTPDETWRMSEQDGGGHARADTWVSCATKGLNLNTINNGHCCFLFIHVCITGLKVKKKWAALPYCSCRPLILFNVFDISPLLFWYQCLLNFVTAVALRRPKQSRLL